MQITVQFFSQLKEIANRNEITVDLPAGATVADLIARLYQSFPELEKWDATLLVGVGVDFVERSRVLHPDDRLALMPPVQGG